MMVTPTLPLSPAAEVSPAGLVSAEVWTRAQWQARQAAHLGRVAGRADAFVSRRSRQEKHPVEDFLFTYYTFSPAKLKQWLPPLGVRVEVTAGDLEALPWLTTGRFRQGAGAVWLDETQVPEGTRGLARWVAVLCANVRERAPRFRCYGLHEWAMVYGQTREEIRHQGYELRVTPEALAELVRGQSLGCSHYDAFRFFTPAARPLNALQPVLETRLEMEQGGCLHANMDLYKWAAKLWPWVGADLVGRCFELACAVRELDMRASPYDLRALGYAPVCIETPEGRNEYEAEQRALAARAVPLREELRLAARVVSGEQ